MNHLETNLLIIGGGATGTGLAWDAALRGFSVVLVEKRDLTHGTTGRYHGLLHSGGRYVVQVGAFTDEINADRLLARLRDGGFDEARIASAEVDGRRYYRVRLVP